MIETDIIHSNHRASWGSVFGGTIAALAISALLSLLGAGLGLSAMDIAQTEVADGIGTGALVYTAISVLISFAAGGYIAGRLAGVEGCAHGFLTWALSVLVAIVLSGMLISSTVHTLSSAVGSVASATGSVVSGAASAVGKGVSGGASLAGDAFDSLGIDMNVSAENTTDDVKKVLTQSGIEQLQPGYLESQAKAVRDDVAAAGKKALAEPDNMDAIIKELTDKVKARGQKLGEAIDKDKLATAFVNVNGMTQPEAEQAADEVIQTRDKAVQSFKQGIETMDKKIEEAKVEMEQAKQQALEKAEKAKEAAAKGAIWSFVSLLIAAIISSVLGHVGAASTRRRYETVVRHEPVRPQT